MNDHYPFKLPPIPYSYDALEPYIGKETLYYHYDKLFRAYIDNLNKTLEPFPMYHNWSLEKLLTNLSLLPNEIQVPVSRYAGGTYNHNMYFNSMFPVNKGHQNITRDMEYAIKRFFGSYNGFKEKMKSAGMAQFGSGWAFLVADTRNGLYIINMDNQEVPLCDTTWPILPLDVWEHAYYLQYKNLRSQYIDNWFNVIDWVNVCKRINFVNKTKHL